MRRAWRLAVLAVLASAALGAAVPACFNPVHPACAFTCFDPPHTCPAGYTCGADNLCHDPNNQGFCDIELPDAATEDEGGADAEPDSRPDVPPDSQSQ